MDGPRGGSAMKPRLIEIVYEWIERQNGDVTWKIKVSH
jgi:hypothetical protein